MKIKKGYTLIEIMLCIIAVILVLGGAFTLFGKYNTSLMKQTKQNNLVYLESSVFLELNEKILDAKNISFENNSLDLHNGNIVSVEKNKLYLNKHLLLEDNSGVSLDFVNKRVLITIGGKIWTFRSLNTET